MNTPAFNIAFAHGMEVAVVVMVIAYPEQCFAVINGLIRTAAHNLLITAVRGCNFYLYVRGWLMYQRLKREFNRMGLDIGPYKFTPLQERENV